MAAAVILCRPVPRGLADSKKLCATRRGSLDRKIRARCIWGIGVIDVPMIDRVNIFGATMAAMTAAVSNLEYALRDRGYGPCDHVLIDGNCTPAGRIPAWNWPCKAVIGGDGCEPAISAASIIAKEHRDRLMRDAARTHPHYGWERNKGYGTREHLAALQRHGPSPLHRRSFAPVAQLELSV